MSINLFALAWQISFPGKPAKKLVLLSLADSTNAAHDYTWPSYDTIAERCGISRRAVINAVNELEAEGIVTREARYKAGSKLRTSNAFRLNISVLRRLANANAKAFYSAEDGQSMVNSVHHNGEYDAPYGEHIAPTGEFSSPPIVNTVHPYGEHSSPKPEVEPEDRTRREPEGGRSGAVAPARPASSPPFQPVPDSVKQAKRRRGDAPPEAAITATAPPAIRLLHQLTGYWPGVDVTDALVGRFGDAPEEVALARAVELWRLSGNKPTNYLGIADWYDELCRDPTWEPQKRFKPNTAAQPGAALSPSERAAAEYAAIKRSLTGGR